MMSIPFNVYNPHANVCEWFDFECMYKNDRKIYLWKDFNNFGKKITSNPYTNGDKLLNAI